MHVTRAVCRRAERMILRTGRSNPSIKAYINRLSDFLFVAARWCCKEAGGQDGYILGNRTIK